MKSGRCARCHGDRRCDLCDAPYRATQIDLRDPEPAQRVLVIDDDPSMRTLLGLWFGDDERCQAIAEVPSAEAAFVEVAIETPDAIVCDLHLGALTGEVYLPGLRNAAPNARIVVYTCDPQLAYDLDVFDLGADAVLDKTSAPLEQLVDTALQAPTAALH